MKIKTRRTLIGAAWACVGILGLSALTGVAVAAEQSRGAGSTAVAAASAGPSGTGATTGRRGLRALGSRLLHGELTVRTKNGVRTVDTQAGTVTTVSSTSLTVRSADGFSLTWTLGSDTVVRDAGVRSSAAAIAVGQTVRVLGPAATSSTGSPTARLVSVRPATATGTGAGGQASATPSTSSST